MEKNKKNISGSRLKKCLQEYGIKQTVLAQKIHCSPQRINHLVTGVRNITLDTAKDISNALFILTEGKADIIPEYLTGEVDIIHRRDFISIPPSRSSSMMNVLRSALKLIGYFPVKDFWIGFEKLTQKEKAEYKMMQEQKNVFANGIPLSKGAYLEHEFITPDGVMYISEDDLFDLLIELRDYIIFKARRSFTDPDEEINFEKDKCLTIKEYSQNLPEGALVTEYDTDTATKYLKACRDAKLLMRKEETEIK